jgi:hypothetical protein
MNPFFSPPIEHMFDLKVKKRGEKISQLLLYKEVEGDPYHNPLQKYRSIVLSIKPYITE